MTLRLVRDEEPAAGEVLSKSAPLGLVMRARARRRVPLGVGASVVALGLVVIADAVLVSLGVVHLIELLGGR